MANAIITRMTMIFKEEYHHGKVCLSSNLYTRKRWQLFY